MADAATVMHILLVEDNPGDARLIQEYFREDSLSEQFAVTVRASIAQSLQFLNDPASAKVDAILLDLGLPDATGLEAVEKLQKYISEIPTIVLTGMDDNVLALRAVKEGAQDYLIKNQMSGQLLAKSVLYAVERQHVEAQKNKNKVAEETNRRKSEFLSMMSHEIRNPLGIIIGVSDLLLQASGQADFKGYARTIQANAIHLNALINDVLDLTRIEAGRIDLEKTSFNLRQELEQTCAGLREQAASKGLSLGLAIDPSVPEMITTDATRLRQILYNLVGNAVKFTEQGGIQIMVKTAANGDTLQIHVTDTGCGVDKPDQEKLFRPFSQANTSIYRKFKGTGLGLNLSRQIAQSLGGELVLLHSEPGKGSVFSLTIPTGHQGAAVEPATRSEKITAAKPNPLQGIRVLIADDDAVMRELEENAFVSAGASVKAVENGRLALREIAAERPDIAFMDIHMPELGGLDAVKALRTGGHNFPIIALTAADGAEEKAACLNAGYSDFLSKPFRIAALIDMAVKWTAKS